MMAAVIERVGPEQLIDYKALRVIRLAILKGSLVLAKARLIDSEVGTIDGTLTH